MKFYISLIFLTITPTLNNATTLGKSLAIFFFGTLYFLKSNYIVLSRISILIFSFIMIFLLTSSFLNNLTLQQFLFAEQGRSFGFLTYLGIFYFCVVLFKNSHEEKKYFDALNILTTLAIIYGWLQVLNLDPIPWAQEYKGIMLTLGNPNYASALFGILSAGPLVRIMYEPSNVFSRSSLFNIFVFSNILFLAQQTDSIQGLVIILVNSTILLVRLLFLSKMNAEKKYFVISFVFLFLILSTYLNWNSILSQGSIRQRISYWNQGIKILEDHYLFGIGHGNMSAYSAAYRSPEMVKQEGYFRFLDRTHNFILDTGINYGVIAAILLVILLTFVTIKAIRVVLNNNDRQGTVLLLIWFGYLFQALISPDQVFLMLIGLTSISLIWNKEGAGSDDSHHKSNRLRSSNRKFELFILNTNTPHKVVSMVLVLALVSPIWQVLKSEKIARDVYQKKVFMINDLEYLLTHRALVETFEKVAISLYQETNEEKYFNQFVNRYLEFTPTRGQAWYLNAVKNEKNGDLIKAQESLENALNSDPYNPVYILSLGILEAKLGNMSKATSLYRTLLKIDSRIQNIDLLKMLISNENGTKVE